jgi:uncharacterized membrane protein
MTIRSGFSGPSKNIVLGSAVFAAVGCGLMGGLLFAFSNFVMIALSHQPPESAVHTMQAINIFILNPVFLVVFVGTTAASLALAAAALLVRRQSAAPWLIAGAALYLIGTVGVTMAFNVPLNDRLAVLKPEAAETGRFWLAYLSEWMQWNHCRTVAAILASTSFIVAIRRL